MDELGEVGVELGEGEVWWEGYRWVHSGWFVNEGMGASVSLFTCLSMVGIQAWQDIVHYKKHLVN